MATQLQSGSQTATLDTEHTLGSAVVTAGSFVLVVNLGNMVNGDIVRFKIYTKVRTGDSEAVAFTAHFAHVQGAPNQYSIPVASPFSFKATLEQTDGTGRAFPWAIYEI